MVSLCLGRKPSGVPYLKVLKYDSDNPDTLPNEAYNRFYFNSEAQNLSFVWGYFTLPPLNESSQPIGNRPLSAGSNFTAQWVINVTKASGSSARAQYRVYGLLDRMSGLGILPFVEAHRRDEDGKTRICYLQTPEARGAFFVSYTNQASLAYVEQKPDGYDYERIPSDFGYTGWAIRPHGSPSLPYMYYVGDQGRSEVMIWDLPANTDPIPTPSAPPVSGQEVFRADSSGIVLTRTGFTVDASSGRQRIIDSNRSPIKCVMYGTTGVIGANSQLFVPKTVDFNLSPTMICDAIVSVDGWDFSIPPVELNNTLQAQEFSIHYRVESGGIRFFMDGPRSCRIKYMLYATGQDNYTSGGNQIMRTLPDGHIQMKRPGSSDSAPGYNDILLDTRLPALTVIKQGYVSANQFTESQSVDWRYGQYGYQIPFDGSGMFVFPKVAAHFGTAITQGQYSRYVDNSATAHVTRDSMSVVVRDNEIVCHLSINGYAPQFGVPTNPTGIRYYLLGIAN